MTRPIRLGVLTPSSNTALEPLTSRLAEQIPGCSAHFSRFAVTEIALSAQALGQFDDSKIWLRPSYWPMPRSMSSVGAVPRPAGSVSTAIANWSSASVNVPESMRRPRCLHSMS